MDSEKTAEARLLAPKEARVVARAGGVNPRMTPEGLGSYGRAERGAQAVEKIESQVKTHTPRPARDRVLDDRPPMRPLPSLGSVG
jgi:hypothetical protein